jgi:hypothetical protein
MWNASLCSVLPIGADGLAGEGHSQVWRLRHPEDASVANFSPVSFSTKGGQSITLHL